MDPITIGIIVAAVKILAVVFVIIITFAEIVEWFQENEYRIENDEQLAFTLKEFFDTGKYGIVQGIFDKGANKVLAGRRMQANEIDQETLLKHTKEELVVYT
jgi:hypothetical protein